MKAISHGKCVLNWNSAKEELENICVKKWKVLNVLFFSNT